MPPPVSGTGSAAEPFLSGFMPDGQSAPVLWLAVPDISCPPVNSTGHPSAPMMRGGRYPCAAAPSALLSWPYVPPLLVGRTLLTAAKGAALSFRWLGCQRSISRAIMAILKRDHLAPYPTLGVCPYCLFIPLIALWCFALGDPYMRFALIVTAAALAGCVSTETGVNSFNGSTAEILLYGDTFAFGTQEQKQAQLDAAAVKAQGVCGGPVQYLDRRMDAQPQNGFYYVESKNIAIFKCL